MTVSPEMRTVVGVPTYKRPAKLKALLESLEPSLRAFDAEVVVADNACAAESQAVVEAFAARWPKTTYVPVPERGISAVRNALIAVNKGGTGTRVFAGAPYSSAGKTGTAQAVSLGQNVKYNAKLLEEHQRDHSLYAAFAPAEAPEIAVAVIVENAGFGAAHAAPIARRVFDYWLLGDYPSEEDIAAVRKGQASAPLGKPRKAADIVLPTP